MSALIEAKTRAHAFWFDSFSPIYIRFSLGFNLIFFFNSQPKPLGLPPLPVAPKWPPCLLLLLAGFQNAAKSSAVLLKSCSSSFSVPSTGILLHRPDEQIISHSEVQSAVFCLLWFLIHVVKLSLCSKPSLYPLKSSINF